jgi:uncharacterized protein YecE (DUF72 family)
VDPLRIGCSGWQYDHWRGTFYPDDLPKRRWFDHYARSFDAVEINATYYRLPTERSIDRWHDQAPRGFRYAVKGSRLLTTMKKLNDPADALATFMERVGPLRAYLGVVLWQLPPSFGRDDARLEGFLDELPARCAHAFEFRHRSWFDDAVYDMLDAHGAWFVVHDFEAMEVPRQATGGGAYLRLHGHPAGDYGGSYPDEVLEGWSSWLRDMLERNDQAWVLFNNDAGGAAPADARRLAGLMGR